MEEFYKAFGVENEIYTEEGDINFDKLNPLEREEYFKMLNIVQSSEVTLADFKNFFQQLRIAIDSSLADEPEFIYSSIFPFLKRPNPKIAELKARLKNCIIFERFLFRPDQAKAVLEVYKKKLKK